MLKQLGEEGGSGLLAHLDGLLHAELTRPGGHLPLQEQGHDDDAGYQARVARRMSRTSSFSRPVYSVEQGLHRSYDSLMF